LILIFSSELYIIDGPQSKVKETPLRSLKADLIGGYVTARGMVTKVSDVRPMVSVACYVCEVCGFEIYQTVNSKIFMPLVDCPSNICKQNKTRGKLISNTRLFFELCHFNFSEPQSLFLIKKSKSKKLLIKFQWEIFQEHLVLLLKEKIQENALLVILS